MEQWEPWPEKAPEGKKIKAKGGEAGQPIEQGIDCLWWEWSSSKRGGTAPGYLLLLATPLGKGGQTKRANKKLSIAQDSRQQTRASHLYNVRNLTGQQEKKQEGRGRG